MTIADVHRGYSVKKKADFFNRISRIAATQPDKAVQATVINLCD